MEIGSHSSSVVEDPPPIQPTLRKAGGWKAVKYILGAFVSDAFLGRFLTLFFGSIASFLGMGAVTLTAGLRPLRPPTCHGQTNCPQPQKWQLGFLFAALGLLSIGSGSVRPCNIAFGADQFDITTEKGKQQLESFFNWWYFSFTIALLIALSAVVYIQTNVSWVIGFAIPTACLAFSIFIFLMGRRTYIYKKPQGSVFADIAKVITAAVCKRRITAGPGYEQCNFYDPLVNEKEAQFITKLSRTDRFSCLDKAAMIISPSELNAHGMPKNSWRLCSVQQVEQLKCLVGTLPVWFSGIGCLIAMDQQNTFGVLQAIQMNRSIGPHFKIPPGWMSLTSMITLSIWISVYERIYIPQLKKIRKRESRLTMQQRIRTGIVMSILCMLVAGIVEKKRRDSALKQGSFASPLSVAMLLPQFALSGMTEAFAAVALMEFFTRQMPESMRSVAGSSFFLSLAIASYLSSLIVNVIHSITGKNGREPWLGGHDLNNHRLEYYYYIIAAIGVMNFIYFTFFASHYVFSTSDDISTTRELKLENIISNHPINLSTCESKGEDE
ncbi:hypothetical protein F0562_023485 [Nyssa sinensis]|uniref:Major facilitator superfamily (MFS) profile domain-containing protein n=1 Tax=Nyssa sinensis TaxID=561372 RepID=A0A5J5BI06_9ASTE|nr:hypothetical protein F0562_023485 [Nyssa sinensis]